MADPVDSGTYYTPDNLKLRSQLAAAMMKQGIDASPIQSPWQGLARMANALIGGYGVYRSGEMEKDADKATGAGLLAALGGGASNPVAPSLTTPAASPAPPVTPTANGDFTNFLKTQEGFRAQPYGDNKQTSIGYGTRAQPGDTTITPEEASTRLDVEAGKARQLVQAFAPKLTPDQENALTDLTYNTGTAWMGSGLGQAVKAGDWDKAQRLFVLYNHAGGKVMPALTARREALAGGLVPQEAAAPDVQTPFGPVTSPGTTQPPPEPAQAAPAPAAATPAPAAQTPPASPAAAPTAAPQVDPALRGRIQILMSNPATRKAGEALALEVLKKQAEVSAQADKLGLNPVYGIGPDGKVVIMQLRQRGGAVPVQMPEGVTATKPVMKVDTGTGTQLVNPLSGQPVTTVQKDVAGKEFAEQRGKAAGVAAADLPRIENNAQLALKAIDQIQNHPGKSTGWQGYFAEKTGGIPNTDQRGFINLVKQARGKAFLEAYQSLRGGGAITEIEGAKATDALVRMDAAQSEADFNSALDDFKDVVQRGLSVAHERAKNPSQAAPDAAAAPTKTIGGKTYTKINGQWYAQ